VAERLQNTTGHMVVCLCSVFVPLDSSATCLAGMRTRCYLLSLPLGHSRRPIGLRASVPMLGAPRKLSRHSAGSKCPTCSRYVADRDAQHVMNCSTCAGTHIDGDHLAQADEQMVRECQQLTHNTLRPYSKRTYRLAKGHTVYDTSF
jgi:ribosomal protein L37AE/L43A